MTDSTANQSSSLPCVVQIGFAGSRQLFENPPTDPAVEQQWHDAVVEHLVKSLDELAQQHLSSHHFLCGISQIACGADTLFTHACDKRELPQRIFLPQPVGDYLSAESKSGTPDFTSQQRSEAETLLKSLHIIQQRVVAHSPDRSDRFRETNAEIARVSDVVVCLLREDAEVKAGGTSELLERAKAVGTPVLEIRVAVENGQPVCRNQWQIDPQHPFQPPAIPEPLGQLTLPKTAETIPSSRQYCAPLKDLVSTQAKNKQRFFLYAAAWIIATHILATVCATLALTLHGSKAEPFIPWFLGLELVLLATGFWVHRRLHHSKAVRIWANARVVAELARSTGAIHPRHVYLEHLFRLPLPYRFRPLLRTLNVLHLRSTYAGRNDPWEPQRDDYLVKRVEDQIGYYTKQLAKDKRRMGLCQKMFNFCSILAMAATLAKLILLIATAAHGGHVEFWPQLLGTLAIVLPVLAVAGLSWAAAFDCEARVETFEETVRFLKRRKKALPQADTAAEYDLLLRETETVLLGEVANWFSRRANTGVT